MTKDRMLQDKKIQMLLVPHAPQVWIQEKLAAIYSRIIPEVRDSLERSAKTHRTILLMGGNHSHEGHLFSIYSKGSFGNIPIDEEFGERLLKNCPWLRHDEMAFLQQHLFDAHLSFLRQNSSQASAANDLRIVPLLFKSISFERCQKIANAFAKAILDFKKSVLMIVVSNLNHFEPKTVTKQKDDLIIKAIQNLDALNFFEKVQKHNISVCGATPIIIALEILKNRGIKKMDLLDYFTSDLFNQDSDFTIGYGSFCNSV